MANGDWLHDTVAAQKRGVPRGLTSICSTHPVVLDAAMSQAAEDGLPVLIESTVNQVNQFGGYTWMTPADFRGVVEKIAREVGFPRDRILLGGDHLGPYPWRAGPPDVAMRNARDLVAATVRAGYTKLHLDASMPLSGDRVDGRGRLDPRVAARREAELASVAEATFWGSCAGDEGACSPPVYVIGNEVPPPGGIRSGEDQVPVSDVDALLETVSLGASAFRAAGIEDAWGRVLAVVAQPGVEFGDHEIHAYDRAAAEPLCRAARGIPGIVLEGHSTDYQTPAALRQLVEDGVAILKVGPALTFAIRESLFGLESIERELVEGRGRRRVSSLSATLERAMLDDSTHWAGYYAGTEFEQRLARKFSYSDRARYYWSVPSVSTAVAMLLDNLESIPIPLTLLSQFLPVQYQAVRAGRFSPRPRVLLQAGVRAVLQDYAAATRG